MCFKYVKDYSAFENEFTDWTPEDPEEGINPLWDPKEIILALHMSSGRFDLAHELLNAGFEMSLLTENIARQIFSEQDDAIISTDEKKNELDRVLEWYGAEAVFHRREFLQIRKESLKSLKEHYAD